MARSKRRAFATRKRRPFVKADWVYRPNMQIPKKTDGSDIGQGDSLGTYERLEFTVASGGAAGRILYDSHNRIRHWANAAGGPNAPIMGVLPGAARAEGRNPTILRVQGFIWLRKSAWALGDTIRAGWRIGVFEQQPESGAISIDANYSMWATFGPETPATWANDRMWVRERRILESFGGASDPARSYWVDVKCRRVLKPFQCMGIYLETDSVSVNAIWMLWLRTLVADGG